MFTFNFGGGRNDDEQQDSGTPCVTPKTQCIPSEVPSGVKWEDFSTVVSVEGVQVTLVDPIQEIHHLKASGHSQSGTLLADEVHSDLIPGVYEGGMKIWECSYDLGSVLLSTDSKLFEDKSVLDLGCGSGLLGILALKMGCKTVHFHDYNSEVLSFFTIPNVSLNSDLFLDRSKFWCGDWASYEGADGWKFDLILTSETIYNASNHKKLHNIIKSKLKPEGAAYVAGKSYYFGVGGSMKNFRDVVEAEGVLKVTSIWTSKDGVRREILHLAHNSKT